MPPILSVQNLTFRYNNIVALDAISFDIESGGITALVGHNGAGKSTLMRCIATLDTPFSGTIKVDSVDTQDNPRAIHPKIGYLSDFFGLYDDLTVEQSLRFIAASQGIDAPKERILELSTQLSLTTLLERKTHELSRGQRQRVAIAQAIIHKPLLLLLDEPASGLDPDARHQLSELLLQLKDQGITIIVSSHILSELEDYSNYMLILQQGTLKEHASLKDLQSLHSEITLEVDGEISHYQTTIENYSNVKQSSFGQGSCIVTFEGDNADKHAFLSYLLEHAVPICHFSSGKKRFETLYRESVHHEEA